MKHLSCVLIHFFNDCYRTFGRTVKSHAFNPSITEAGTGGSLGLRPTWYKERVLGWSRLQREIFS